MNKTITFLHWVLIICVDVALSKDICKPLETGNTLLTCVSMPQCPSLIDKISRLQSRGQKIRHLQSLTCGFDGSDPKVCCSKASRKMTMNLNLMSENTEKVSMGNFPPSLNECGKSERPETSDYILGGRIADLGMFPWIARVGFKGTGQSSFEYICGGTLISRNWILLAAHCLLSLDTTQYNIRLGEHDTSKNPEFSFRLGIESNVKDYDVEQIISHANFNSSTKHDDIALIRLSENVKFTPFIKPICLPFLEKYKLPQFPDFGLHKNPNGIMAEVAGFGKTGNNPDNTGSEVLQILEVPLVGNQECAKAYEKMATISPKQMCAGGIEGQDSCSGDSGGGLFFKNENAHHYFQIGIVSYGPKICGSRGFPGIYTRISKYLDWVLNSIKQNS